MSLADHLPSNRKALDGQRIFHILWLAGSALCVAIIALLLLQRLGLTLPYVLGTGSVWIALGFVILAAIGRTMSSLPFFFAGRLSGSSTLGLAGATDFVGGAFLITFLGAGLLGQMVLAPALMFGILVQTILFATAFQRSGVATLPGFFARTGKSQTLGLASLLVLVPVMLMLIVAEFQVTRASVLSITRLDETVALWGMLILATLPCVTGGWLSLVLVNGVMTVWMLIGLLLPAVVTGFAPGMLRSDLVLEQNVRQEMLS